MLEFDEDVVPPEPVDVAGEDVASGSEIALVDEAGELAVAAAGKEDETAGVIAKVGGDVIAGVTGVEGRDAAVEAMTFLLEGLKIPE